MDKTISDEVLASIRKLIQVYTDGTTASVIPYSGALKDSEIKSEWIKLSNLIGE